MQIQANFLQSSDDVVEILDALMAHAMQTRSSDIHFEPYHDHYRIRLRQNGLLHEIPAPATMLPRLITRLKIIAQLDIAEQRLPQDGRCSYLLQSGHTIDLRISSCPTLFGEKIAVRLLNHNGTVLALESLGLLDLQYQQVLRAIQQPQGCILVTGPTGSGKTMTLYSILNFLNATARNIVTLEDPIEIYLRGVNQTAINHKLHLTFAHMLRAMMRQDPDIIMVGEIRDLETAEIALQAAETGHLVLSTLHANNTLHAIDRLAHLGIARYKIASNISLIIAQRLLRQTAFEDNCRKRVAVFECLPMQAEFEPLIIAQQNEKIMALARLKGFKTLYEVASENAAQCSFTQCEIDRVIARAL